MNISNLIETEKVSSESTKTPRIDANTGFDEIDCENVDSLFVSYDYAQEIPIVAQIGNVLKFYKMKDKHKNDFWKDLLDVDREHFKDFIPLFDQIEKIFDEAT